MKTFASRRWRNLALLVLAAGLVLFLDAVLAVSLRPASLYTGWLLAVLMVFLACYNLFKKVPFLPLGTSSTWLQLHVYVGVLTILVFILHAGPHLPHGPLGWVMEVLFIGVAGSGLLGLLMSRVFPRLLRSRGEEVIFEHIPVARRRLQERAERLVLDATEKTHSSLIADFYMARLKAFFDAPRNFWRHVLRVSAHRHALLTEIDAQARYLDENERKVLQELRGLVESQGRPGFPLRPAGDAQILAVRPRAAIVQLADLLGVSHPRDLGLCGSDPMTDPRGDDQNHSYERPEQHWVCGWAAEGKPCPFGPSPGGLRDGVRVHPAPKRRPLVLSAARRARRPVSRRASPRRHMLPPHFALPTGAQSAPQRGLLVFLAAALSLGAILWLTAGPASHEFHSPGDLTFKHGTVTSSCGSCHTLPSERPTDLLQAAMIPHKDAAQTQLCLKCHDLGDQGGLGDHGTLAHGAPPELLRELTQKAGDRPHQSNPLLLSLAKSGLGVPRAADGSLTCGTCHREHQGRQFDLNTMDNHRCQACHVQQFASLDQGHPEFRNYPYHQRTAIFFDHVSHLGRHFKDFHNIMPDGKAPQSCIDCHGVDPSGKMMLVKSFEQTCASCHLPQVMDTSLGGVPFLNLPGLDVATLRVHEQQSAWVETMTAVSALPVQSPMLPVLAALFRDERLVVQPPFPVGEWPAAAAGDPTPFMQLLASADREGAAALETLRGVNLCDLRQASPHQIKAAGVLMWRVKELFYDTIQEGDRALTRRLGRLAGPPLTSEQGTLLTADLPSSVVLRAQQSWLPSLLTEVPNYRARRPKKVSGTLESQFQTPFSAAPPAQPEAVRWRIHDGDCSIQYLPRRHTDLFLRSWLDVTGERYGSAGPSSFAAVFDVLASPYSPGRCVKCHGVEARPNHSRVVHWLPAHPVANKHKFTTFAHQPHFSLLGGQQCERCHSLHLGGNYQESFRKIDHSLNIDPTRFASNFLPMKKADCTDCHVSGKASNSCLLCHNYHVGKFSPFQVPLDQFHNVRLR